LLITSVYTIFADFLVARFLVAFSPFSIADRNRRTALDPIPGSGCRLNIGLFPFRIGNRSAGSTLMILSADFGLFSVWFCPEIRGGFPVPSRFAFDTLTLIVRHYLTCLSKTLSLPFGVDHRERSIFMRNPVFIRPLYPMIPVIVVTVEIFLLNHDRMIHVCILLHMDVGDVHVLHHHAPRPPMAAGIIGFMRRKWHRKRSSGMPGEAPSTNGCAQTPSPRSDG